MATQFGVLRLADESVLVAAGRMGAYADEPPSL